VTESCPDFAIVQIASYCITPPAFVRVTVRFSPSWSGFKQCTGVPAAHGAGDGRLLDPATDRDWRRASPALPAER